ncbi:MAG: MBL fold metallo-hydrolase [Candidatus Cloacimonetes bacterium]|nr:MBL fold metallo-hydrolase [Candidatus Cloacimonadota bacterium]
MRIDIIPTNPHKYSSNVYLIRGDFNSLNDVNTLIDTGADDYIINEIRKINTGAGKKAIEQVILTHNHFDHTGGLKSIKQFCYPIVLGYTPNDYIDKKINHGQTIKVGDVTMEVINITEHSNDSICLYEWSTKTLFTGDTPIDIKSEEGSYSEDFLEKLGRIEILGVNAIYPGHGEPILKNALQVISKTVEIIKKSRLKRKGGDV